MAPKLPPETKLNWLRKDEWETIKRQLFPTIRYNDVFNELLIQKWQEEQSKMVHCCHCQHDRQNLPTSSNSNRQTSPKRDLRPDPGF
jgi:hypothetical protein